MTSSAREAIIDHQGRIMFYCSSCGTPLTKDDFFEIGLRLPDYGETAGDYAEAELLDTISHIDCLRAARAG